ncbi:MAG: hypothetical protein R3B55_00110 [Candidatus Paceibacterota bacterium]
MDLSKQYDDFAEDFSVNQKDKNQTNREEMYKMIGENISGKKLLTKDRFFLLQEGDILLGQCLGLDKGIIID